MMEIETQYYEHQSKATLLAEENVEAEEVSGTSAENVEEEWSPKRLSFLLALGSILPYLCYISYRMNVSASIPYFIFLGSSVPYAIKLQECSMWIRWINGFCFVSIMSVIKTSVLLSAFQDDSVAFKGLFYTFTALWECSNAVCIFGGREYLERYGITSFPRAFLVALCPAQLTFLTGQEIMMQKESSLEKWKRKSLHLIMYGVAFFAIRYILKSYENFILEYVILEAEGIVLLTSCLVNIWNIPVHVFQLFMLCHQHVQVIYPYGGIYFSSSSREFWSKWSRPASSLIRHIFYYPLGGKRRAYMSIPLMFLMNASSHYSVSEVVVGERSEKGWNTVFGLLGLVATVEVLGNTFIPSRVDENDIVTSPKWWAIVRFLLAMVALRFTAYGLFHWCLHTSLASLL